MTNVISNDIGQFIGKQATIVGAALHGDEVDSGVAHICLEIDGKRVWLQADDCDQDWLMILEGQ